jgi:hypothetical protein
MSVVPYPHCSRAMARAAWKSSRLSPSGKSGMPFAPGYDCNDANPLQAQRAERLPRFWVIPLRGVEGGGFNGGQASGRHPTRATIVHGGTRPHPPSPERGEIQADDRLTGDRHLVGAHIEDS